jgi:hypothetical protein
MSEAIRKLVADKIKADNSTFTVHAYPVPAPENIPRGKVFINVYRETLTNQPESASLGEDLRILVMTPSKNTDAAESALEDALDAVLTSITALNYVQWSTATRATFADTWIGYEIVLRAATENPYKP